MPTTGKVWFDMDTVADVAQQPQTQQIAVYEATPNEECINGKLLDVNQHFVVYAVKNGLIRVLHRHSALRSLLRGHAGQQVTDIQFFLDGDVLGTVGSSNGGSTSSTIIIWRVFEQSPEIMSEKLLEISSNHMSMSRLVWHPFNPNQFWMFHTDDDSRQKVVATLCETTRIQTIKHPQESHAVCQFHSPTHIMDGAVQLSNNSSNNNITGSLTDLCWSGRDTRHVLTVHESGHIVLWDMKQLNGSDDDDDNSDDVTRPKILSMLQEPDPQSRCFFLPHENTVQHQHQTDTLTTCFGTASDNNRVITLWSSFCSSGPPTKLQTLTMEHASPSYVIDLCFGPAPQDASPPSCFVLVGDRHAGKLLAFHVQSTWNAQEGKSKKALCLGSDYVVPFWHKHPIYSWCVVCSPTTDISEEELQEQGGLIFDMKLFSYQQKVVQCLTLTSYMCLPPERTWSDPTPGVRVERLEASSTPVSSAVVSEDDYDEEYEVEDLDDNEEDEEDNEEEEETLAAVQAPDPSALPAPDAAGMYNPFANWLGAIATKTSGAMPPPPPPPPSTPAAGFFPPKNNSNNNENASAIAIAPPGLPTSSMDTRSASVSSATSSQQQLLSPMDILTGKTTEPTPAQSAPTLNANASVNANANVNKRNNKSPKPKKTRSKSPKGNRNKNANNNNNNNINNASKSPFPEGAKISILKRDDKATPALAPPMPMPPNPPLPSLNNNNLPLDHHPTIPLTMTTTTTTASSNQNQNNPAMVAPLVMASSLSAEGLEESMNKVLATHLEKQQTVLTSQIQKAVAQQMDKMVITVTKSVQENLASSLRPLSKSIDELNKKGVQVNKDDFTDAVEKCVEEPLRATMADSMRNVFIPAFESVTSQVVAQISESIPQPPPPQDDSKLDALTAQMAAMSATLERMASEIDRLHAAAAAGGGGGGTPMPQGGANNQSRGGPSAPRTPPPQMETIRNDINILVQQRQYESAFTKALSASTADMAVYCCSKASIGDVLGGSAPGLSQPILLCLMQQLGAVLVTAQNEALEVTLTWLQEIALTLNPTDSSIQRHVATVLQQLTTSINQKMNQGDPQLRRPLHMLLQVIRGMQLG